MKSISSHNTAAPAFRETSRFPISPYVLDLTPRGIRQNFLQQVAALGLVVCLCASSVGITFGKANDTISYFRDEETSTGNIFRAGLLGFSVAAEGTGYTFDGPTDPDGGYHTSLVIPDAGSLPMQYKISIEKNAGSDVFCSALAVNATTSPLLYTGTLLGLSTTTSSQGPFDFGILLTDAHGLVDGDICTIDIVYLGWSLASTTPFGYTDVQRTRLTFRYAAPPQIIQSVTVLTATDSTSTPAAIDASSTPDNSTSETGTTEPSPSNPVVDPPPAATDLSDTTAPTEAP